MLCLNVSFVPHGAAGVPASESCEIDGMPMFGGRPWAREGRRRDQLESDSSQTSDREKGPRLQARTFQHSDSHPCRRDQYSVTSQPSATSLVSLHLPLAWQCKKHALMLGLLNSEALMADSLIPHFYPEQLHSLHTYSITPCFLHTNSPNVATWYSSRMATRKIYKRRAGHLF